jgi:hypothetical protein
VGFGFAFTPINVDELTENQALALQEFAGLQGKLNDCPQI